MIDNNQFLCKHYDEETGHCCFSKPYCPNPLSKESCYEYQYRVEKAYKYGKPDEVKALYEPSEQRGFKKKTRKEVFEGLVDNGATVCEYFIPDYKWNMTYSDLAVWDYGWDQIMKRMKTCHSIYFIHGYIHPATNEEGTLFLGVD